MGYRCEITLVTHLFSALVGPYRGYNSIYNDRRDPPCKWLFQLDDEPNFCLGNGWK